MEANLEKYFLAAMGWTGGLGNKGVSQLVKFFGSARVAWHADIADLTKMGISRKALDAFISLLDTNFNLPDKIFEYCAAYNIKICSFFDADYPPILKEIDTPPMIFYYRGELQPNAKRIAVVGSRNNTSYGAKISSEFGEKIAGAGLTVVSGAARGIDTFAHRGALKTGRTVAVMGCGINYIFPRENKKLLEEIAESGVVLSEFPPNMPPSKITFPQRNRIIAGLSHGVVVVEAKQKSGSVITANFALKYSRKLFAVPNSEGCDILIQNGAIPVESTRKNFYMEE